MYPCSSTGLERSLLQEQLAVRYGVMKRKWQRFLTSAVRIRLNGTDGKIRSGTEILIIKETLFHCFYHSTLWNLLISVPAELVEAVRYFNQRQVQAQQQTQDQSEAVRDRLAFLELQAQVSWLQLIVLHAFHSHLFCTPVWLFDTFLL